MKKTLYAIMLLVYICIPLWAKSEDIDTHDLLAAFYESGYQLPLDIEEQDLYCTDGVLFGKDTLLLYPEWIDSTYYVIPDGIVNVFDFAFYGNSFIESVAIPSSCQKLGYRSFGDCFSLCKVSFIGESHLLIVDDYCFCGCHDLMQFELPQSLYIIGDEAFAETSLSTINIPRNIKLIGDYAYAHTIINRIVFAPESRPKYVGNEWVTLSANEVITIILPFDANINLYFENASYITQMENVVVLYHSDE